MLPKKITAILLSSLLLLSGCGQSIDTALENNTVSSEITIIESQILQDLPEGVLAFAMNFTSPQDEKLDILLEGKKLIPKEVLQNLEGTPFANDQLLKIMARGLEYSFYIEPKEEELEFLLMKADPEKILNSQVCIAAEATFQKSAVISILTYYQHLSEEKAEEKMNEGFITTQAELQKNKEKFPFLDITFTKNKEVFEVSVISKACDEGSRKASEKFFLAVQNQDTATVLLSADKKFFLPFFAPSNLAILKLAYTNGRKEFIANAQETGFSTTQLREIESLIIDPLKKMNGVKMIASLEKISYISGPLLGNLFDRHSELVVQFSDDKMAELFAEVQEGKIPSAKLWLNEETKYEASVSRNGSTVYDYSSFQNTEYPSVMTNFRAVVGITMVGILAAGATGIYTKSQEKARAAVRQNQLELDELNSLNLEN